MAGAAPSRPRRVVGRLAAARRRSPVTGLRLAVCVALVALAVAIGGAGGALLGILTFMLLVDGLVPMPGVTRTDADERFRRLVRRRRRAQRVDRLRRRPPRRLRVLDDRTGWMASAERRPLGVHLIAIASVTATVEALQARAFDAEFRPERASAEHWKRLWLAQAHGAALPPISVYRVGAEHVVCDGHHRISVARDLGLEAIEAEVVELRRAAGAAQNRVRPR